MAITPITYLDEAVHGVLVPMFKEVSTVLDKSFPGQQVYVDAAPKADAPTPLWWLYPGESAATETRGVSQGTETYVVYARLVLGYRANRYDGKWAGQLWVFLPTLRRYFSERPSLIYQTGQNKPSNLQSASLGAFSPFGVFDDGTDHIGLEAALTLTFLTGYRERPNI